MIEDLIRHLRKDAEGHRVTFTNTDPPGGKNAELFDRWADEVESLRSRVAELEIQLNVAKGVLSCSANSPDMDGENHAHRANNALEQMDR